MEYHSEWQHPKYPLPIAMDKKFSAPRDTGDVASAAAAKAGVAYFTGAARKGKDECFVGDKDLGKTPTTSLPLSARGKGISHHPRGGRCDKSKAY